MRRSWIWLLTPALALMLVFFLLPLVVFGFQSLHLDTGSGAQAAGITLANYRRVLTNTVYLRAFWTTVRVSALVTVVATLVGFPAAYLIARINDRLTRLLMIVMLAPNFVSPVVKSVGWVLTLGLEGPLNRLLVNLGLVDRPLRLVNSMLGVVIGEVQYVLPLLTLILVGVIRRIDPAVEEAAAILGAPRWRIFTRVVIPMCLRPLVLTSLMIFALTAGSYTTVVLLGGGHVVTVPVLIAQEVLARVRYGVGSALAVTLVVLFLALSGAGTRLAGIQRRQT